MPSLSASDYTNLVKVQAASLAYQNNRVPTTIQTSAQPFATQAAISAILTASQASLVTLSTKTTQPYTKLGRVVPYPGYGRVNNPKNLSTVSTSGAGTTPLAPRSAVRLFSPPPPGRAHVE